MCVQHKVSCFSRAWQKRTLAHAIPSPTGSSPHKRKRMLPLCSQHTSNPTRTPNHTQTHSHLSTLGRTAKPRGEAAAQVPATHAPDMHTYACTHEHSHVYLRQHVYVPLGSPHGFVQAGGLLPLGAARVPATRVAAASLCSEHQHIPSRPGDSEPGFICFFWASATG